MGYSYEHDTQPSGSVKYLKSFRVAAQLVTSQEGLSSRKAVKFRKYPTGHSPPPRFEDYVGAGLQCVVTSMYLDSLYSRNDQPCRNN
jgi:hypothetical protein